MTPKEWYKSKRQEYFKVMGEGWTHKTDQVDDPYSFVVAETVMRSAIECKALSAYGWDEYIEVANAILIRDFLRLKNETNG